MNDLERKVIDNKHLLTTKKQGFMNGSAKVGDSGAVSIGYAPTVCGIQLGVDWFKTKKSALERGKEIIAWIESKEQQQ